MAACATLGYVLAMAGVTPLRPLRSRAQLGKVALLSGIFCITIVLGNLSLKYIPVSFNQAVGATTPFFTAIFAAVMQGAPPTLPPIHPPPLARALLCGCVRHAQLSSCDLKEPRASQHAGSRESKSTYLTLVPIAGGVVLASGGEPLFNAIGFTACLLATSGRALKSVVQAMLLTDTAERLDAMSLLFYMSTISCLLLLPATLLLEAGVFAQVRPKAPGCAL